MIFTTQEQLDAALAKWQGILGLSDWKLIAKIVRAGEWSGNCQGDILIVGSRLEAGIRLLDPLDWKSECWFPQDHEMTLVHELCHLIFHPYVREVDDANEELAKRLYTQEEQAIRRLERALVMLDRRGSPTETVGAETDYVVPTAKELLNGVPAQMPEISMADILRETKVKPL